MFGDSMVKLQLDKIIITNLKKQKMKRKQEHYHPNFLSEIKINIKASLAPC